MERPCLIIELQHHQKRLLRHLLIPELFHKEEVELQMVLFETLLPHYRKLETYLTHIPQEKRFQVLAQFLKLFTPEQAKQIGEAIAGKL